MHRTKEMDVKRPNHMQFSSDAFLDGNRVVICQDCYEREFSPMSKKDMPQEIKDASHFGTNHNLPYGISEREATKWRMLHSTGDLKSLGVMGSHPPSLMEILACNKVVSFLTTKQVEEVLKKFIELRNG
jgi:hypothetical protein